ncbi:MAG: galactokinase [Bacteroidia bacterium]|nr:galactokinase [Bacteroidia bacterium]
MTKSYNSISEEIKHAFVQRFDKKPTRGFFAPGRVNLIGEHIDYNGGLVMPFAIPMGIFALVATSENGIEVFSDSEPVVFRTNTENSQSWHRYIQGVLTCFQQKTQLPLPNCQIYLHSNLPKGAGLSSSAALEVVLAYILFQLCHIEPDRRELAKLAQQAEIESVGVHCGIMDQAAISLSKQNQILQLNCQTLETTYYPFHSTEHCFIILNTNQSRTLAGSAYNERKAACDRACNLLEIEPGKLVTATNEQISALPIELQPIVYHVVSEQIRVLLLGDSLKQGNWEKIGQLMNESHKSLKDNYRVTGHELDTIVAAAQSHPACLGARMTGAGFGGCAIALVKKEFSTQFQDFVCQHYQKKTGKSAECYQVVPVNACEEILIS